MKKKTLYFIIIILILVALIVVWKTDLLSFKKDNEEISKITLKQLPIEDKSFIKVEINLAKNTGLTGMLLTLEYDESKMVLTGVNRGEIFNNFNFNMTNEEDLSDNPFKFLWFQGVENDYSTGVLLTLTFRVYEEAEGLSTIMLSNTKGHDVIRVDSEQNVSYTDLDIHPVRIQLGNIIPFHLVSYFILSILTLLIIYLILFLRKTIKKKRMPKPNESQNYSPFFISRALIIKYIKKESKETKVIERSRSYWPTSLKVGNRTYALLYEKEQQVKIIVRLSNDYAKELWKDFYIKKAKFPNGKNWFLIMVDSRFKNENQVYDILKEAKEFIKNK